MDRDRASKIASTGKSLFETLAIIVAGLWAYFRFVRFRMLKPRVAFSFSARILPNQSGAKLAIVTVKLTNNGNTKLSLAQPRRLAGRLRSRQHRRNPHEGRCFLRFGVTNAGEPPRQALPIHQSPQELSGVVTIFATHEWIEPQETIDDIAVLQLPSGDAAVLQLYAAMYVAARMSSSAAFPVVMDVTSPARPVHGTAAGRSATLTSVQEGSVELAERALSVLLWFFISPLELDGRPVADSRSDQRAKESARTCSDQRSKCCRAREVESSQALLVAG